MARATIRPRGTEDITVRVTPRDDGALIVTSSDGSVAEMTVPAGEALTVVVRCTGPVAERGTIYVLPTAASDGVLEHGRDHVEAKVTALLRRAHEDAEARAAEVDDDQVVHPLRAARDR